MRGIKYYLKREDGRRIGEIINVQIYVKNRGGETIFNYQHNLYDLLHLQAYYESHWLAETQKENVRLFFVKLNPVIVRSAIEDNPQEDYLCDSYRFRRDMAETNCRGHIVVKALIESLYQLRNILFHGELTPTESAAQVYKNGYFLLKMLLDKIR